MDDDSDWNDLSFSSLYGNEYMEGPPASWLDTSNQIYAQAKVRVGPHFVRLSFQTDRQAHKSAYVRLDVGGGLDRILT